MHSLSKVYDLVLYPIFVFNFLLSITSLNEIYFNQILHINIESDRFGQDFDNFQAIFGHKA